MSDDAMIGTTARDDPERVVEALLGVTYELIALEDTMGLKEVLNRQPDV
tara:strand:- start:177 stop:323 length:147 start_codon:yes stop_codon:yes gene_type:complete